MLKYFGTPLVEEGPCTVDPGQHAPQAEPEGEPEGEPEAGGKHSDAEPEIMNHPAFPDPEPEPEPEREETFIGKGWKRGRRRGSQVPRPEPMSRDPSKKVYFIGS